MAVALDEVFVIINQESRATVTNPVTTVLCEGEVGRANPTLLIARDGTEHAIAYSAAPVRDEGGTVNGAVLVFRDITETYRVQEELRKSEARMSFALQTSQTGAWDLDLRGHTAQRTLIHDRIFGYEALLPRWTYEMFLEHVLPEDRPNVEGSLREAKAARSEWRFECRIRRSDGEVRWILVAGGFEQNSAGELVRMAGIVNDITERKLAEAALVENEMLYRSLFESLLNGFAYCRMVFEDEKPTDFIYLAVNAAFASQTGLTNVVGRKVTEVIPGIRETDQQLFDIYGRVSITAKPERFEKFVEALQMWFLISVYSPAYGYFVTVFDVITERKRAELYGRIGREVLQILNEPGDVQDLIRRVLAVLKTETGFDAVGIRLQNGADFPYYAQKGFSEDFLLTENTLIERSSDGGVCRDQDGNARLECTCGLVLSGKTDPANPLFTPGGSCWTNNSFSLLDLPSDQDPRLHPRNKCIHQGYASVALVPIRNKDRIIGLVQLNDRRKGCFTINTVEILEGIASHIGAALMRKQADAEREEGLTRLQKIASRVPGAVYQYRLRPDGTSCFPYVSDGIREIYRLSPEEVRADASLLFACHHPDDSDGLVASIQKSAQDLTAWHHEFRVKFEDAAVRWLSASSLPQREADGSTLWHGFVTDITEHKQMEEHLLRADRVESIGTLAAGVAHDLNNILTPIILSAEMLRTQKQPDVCESLISSIEECAQRGANVVNQVLFFARGVKGDRTTLKLDQLVNDMEKIMCVTFPKNISVTSSIPSDLWPVKGDATHIHQIILNLCINARDAMPEGGTLFISATNEEIDENFAAMVPDAKVGDYATLSISDSGTGMPTEIISKIFDPFFTTKEVGKGTGLGLSSVTGIVRSHGGFVTVESEEGEGSTFKVFLPRETDRMEKQMRIANMEMPQGEGETILLIDDEVILAKIISVVLETNGYKVLVAADGNDALVLYREHAKEIQIVLTDVMMSGMDGVQLARALKEIDVRVKIIASTGQATKTREAELRALGVTVVLHKPYDAKKLLAALHEAIHSKCVEG